MPMPNDAVSTTFHPGDTIAYRWRKYEYDNCPVEDRVHLRPVGTHAPVVLISEHFERACLKGEVAKLVDAPHSLRVDLPAASVPPVPTPDRAMAPAFA